MTVTPATKELSNVTGHCQAENVGTGFKEVQAHKCQQNACLNTIAVPMHQAGWVTDIPQWAREPSNAKYVSIGHHAAVSGPVILGFVTVVVSLCTSWLNHRDAACDTVERKFKVGVFLRNCWQHFLCKWIKREISLGNSANIVLHSFPGSPPPPVTTAPPVALGKLNN